jgi:hypothetical protein
MEFNLLYGCIFFFFFFFIIYFFFQVLKQIIKTMSINYTNTLEKQFILNPPWVLKKTWSVLESYFILFAGKIINYFL